MLIINIYIWTNMILQRNEMNTFATLCYLTDNIIAFQHRQTVSFYIQFTLLFRLNKASSFFHHIHPFTSKCLYVIMVQIAYGYITITPLELTFLLKRDWRISFVRPVCYYCCCCCLSKQKHNICFVKWKTCGSAW